jgi:hypothetical protein
MLLVNDKIVTSSLFGRWWRQRGHVTYHCHGNAKKLAGVCRLWSVKVVLNVNGVLLDDLFSTTNA